jgi:hypothetical protein
MPTKSPAQKRLMQAAAHTKGGCGGVPHEVGKEFTKSKRMAEGGIASLGGMTSSTPNTPNVPVQLTVNPGGSSQTSDDIGGKAPVNNGNIAAGGNTSVPPTYKKGGQVTTRRVSTGSTSKKSPNW